MSVALPWPFPRVLAHRGGGALAPENTIAAIRVGLDRGFRAVEFDAMLAADDVPVLMHDPTLERTGLVGGVVSALPAAELGRVDVGGWHSPRFIGETVPTLERTLRFCRDHDIWPNIEIKPVPGFEVATGAAVARVTSQIYADLIRPEGERTDRFDPRIPLLSSYCASRADRGARGCAESAAGLAGGRCATRLARRARTVGLRVTAYGSSKSDRCTGARDQARRHVAVLLHGQFAATRSNTLQLGESTRSAPMRSIGSRQT